MPRERILTDEDIAKLREWHEHIRAQRRALPTMRDKAEELGVSVETVKRVVYDPTYRQSAKERVTDDDFRHLVELRST